MSLSLALPVPTHRSPAKTELLVLNYQTFMGHLAETHRPKMVAFTERVRFLRGMPLFASWSDQRKVQLAYSLTEVSFGAGDAIMQQGAPAKYVYVVVAGEAEEVAHAEVPVAKCVSLAAAPPAA